MIRLTILLVLYCSFPIFAITPEEICIVINKNVPESKDLAIYYAKVRKVPEGNFVILDLPKEEDISRKDYDEKIVTTLRKNLRDRKEKIKVILCMYGVPLRVGGSVPTDEEKKKRENLEKELKSLKQELKQIREKINSIESKKDKIDEDKKSQLDKQKGEEKKLQAKENLLMNQIRILNHSESQASVDSELMLLWWEKYPLQRWVINANYWKFSEQDKKETPPMMMTCRLDGPSAEIVKRMIDDAIATELIGLQGKVYVDARGIKLDLKTDPSGTGYSGYDESMREMAQLFKDAKMNVILDDKPEVFAAGSCADSALYCGWYSHANFVDSNKFVKGAVAWHLASSEAVSLRRPDAKYWCKNLLEKGACATLGPVAEPYTVGFPKPAEFFAHLATGEYTLVECYHRTVYFASWMGTLIGDPLYKPFAKKPLIKKEDLFFSPKNAKSPFNKS